MSEQSLRDAMFEDFGESVDDGAEGTGEALEEQAAPETDDQESDEEQPDEAGEETEPVADESAEEDVAAGEESSDDGEVDWLDMVPADAMSRLEQMRMDDPKMPTWYRQLKQGRDRAASEADRWRRELESLQAQMQQGEQPKQDSSLPAEPQPPADDADPKEWQKYALEHDRWLVETSQQKTLEAIRGEQEKREQLRQQEEQLRRQQEWGQRQYEALQKREGFDSEVEAAMYQMASEKPYFKAMLFDEGGLDLLFDMARKNVESRRDKLQQIKRKTTAGQRTTPRPKPTPKGAAQDPDIPDGADYSETIQGIVGSFGG
jgi:hypothetical protein